MKGKAQRLIQWIVHFENPRKPEMSRQIQADRPEWGHPFIEEITRRGRQKASVTNARQMIINHLVQIPHCRLQPTNQSRFRMSKLSVEISAVRDITLVAGDDL